MDKFEALTYEANNTRLVELYQILETDESKNVGEIYDDMKMARKIMLSRYNRFSVIGVTIRGVCFYNNNSDRYHYQNFIDEKSKNLIQITINKFTTINILMPFKTVHNSLSMFNETLFCR
jgi:hypothetical protein